MCSGHIIRGIEKNKSIVHSGHEKEIIQIINKIESEVGYEEYI